MSNNLFQSCNSETEIMKRLFELSANKKYSRAELISLSNKRRLELQELNNNNGLEFKKVVIPSESYFIDKDYVKRSIMFSSDPKGSSVFEFLPNKVIRF